MDELIRALEVEAEFKRNELIRLANWLAEDLRQALTTLEITQQIWPETRHLQWRCVKLDLLSAEYQMILRHLGMAEGKQS